jgi:predicted oxidoreductase
METLFIGALIFLGGLFTASFLPSYMKEKGENLATHEDMDKLVAQVEATTRATKAIEARISHEVWDRQRQWEMKRDAVISVVQALGLADDMLLTIGSA